MKGMFQEGRKDISLILDCFECFEILEEQFLLEEGSGFIGLGVFVVVVPTTFMTDVCHGRGDV